MTYLTFAVITALCFALPTTRIYGVVGSGMLLYFYPLSTLGVLALAGTTYYFYRRKIA